MVSPTSTPPVSSTSATSSTDTTSGQCGRLQVTGISGRYDGLNGVYEGTDLQSLDRKVWKHVDTEL